jgi:hypothetical protein
MMMRSPGRPFSETGVVACLLLAPLAGPVLAVAIPAGVFLAVDLLAVVFLALVFLALVLLAGTIASLLLALLPAYFFGPKRGLQAASYGRSHLAAHD